MTTVTFPPAGSPADAGYVPPPGDQVNFPAYARPAPGPQPPVTFPPPGSPTDTGYVPPPGDDVLFPAWVYTPVIRPPVVFPPPGSPVDHPYTPPPGDDVLFPRWPRFTASVLPRKYPAAWAGGNRQQHPIAASWAAAGIIDRAGQSSLWMSAQPADQVRPSPWAAAQSINRGGQAAAWSAARLQRHRAAAPWAAAGSLGRAGWAAPWGLGVSCHAVVAASWLATIIIDGPPLDTHWSAATRNANCVPSSWSAGVLCDAITPSPWGAAALRERLDIQIPIVWPIEPDPLYEIPARGTYAVNYSAIIVTLPDRIELDVGVITIEVDLDRWAISLSTTCLDQAGYNRIRPASGEAIAIEATIQGEVFEFLVDAPTERREWNADNWAFTATSQTIRLGAPYAVPGELAGGPLATAQQHALSELPPSGWTLQWDAVDWPVSAGAWYYHGLTPAQAIARLAAAAGGALQSEPAGQAWRVVKRYPVMPWDLPGATPDYSIPLATCITTTRRPTVLGTRPDAVYVHGGESGGQLGHIVRSGTAGSVELATVVNPLMTDSIALRALGGRLLADQYHPPELQSITLPLGNASSDHPRIILGKIIALTDGSLELLAISKALTIQVTPPGLNETEGPEITQTVTLHGQSTNPYSRLQSLTPQPPLLVGTVLSSTASSATIQLIGGGLITARGTAAVSQRVYVRSGIIEGPAPTLPQTEITV